MGVYLGYIEKKNGNKTNFFNFKPIFEIMDEQIKELTDSDLEDLLPESARRNINFSFNWYDQEKTEEMERLFVDKSLFIFEFTLDDLEDNFRANTNERNPTGYKVQALDMFKEGKIRYIDSEGIFYAVSKNELLSDFTNDVIVEIDTQDISEQNKIFIEFENYWTGPYEVGYRIMDSIYYIKPQIKENKYTVNGYDKNDIAIKEIRVGDNYWNLLMLNRDVKIKQIDVINDKLLIEGFRDSVQNTVTFEKNINLDNINSLLERYDESVLSGSVLTKEIKENRLNRLLDILTSEENVDYTLSTITDIICDLLVKYQKNENVEKWLQNTIEEYPDLIEHLKETKTISERVDQMNQNLMELKGENEKLEEEIRKKRDEANEINKAAIEAKTAELLEKEIRYNELCENINNAKQTYGLIEDIVKLQSQKSALKKDVDYYEQHRDHLNRQSTGLEIKFNQLINDSYEKMFNIAFDGFIANKMLSAAAKWESDNAEKNFNDIINKINNIEVESKNANDLIAYLCKTIQNVRPN